jgi:UDPglucose 6-dehydrogenase
VGDVKVVVAGLGVVGKPIFNSLKKRGYDVSAYDPPKKLNTDLWECDVVFSCVPVPNKDGKQDLSYLIDVISKTGPTTAVFIRSTILPGTTDKLRKKFCKPIWSMPEFLTARRAAKDFNALPLICSGGWTVLKYLFPDKKITVMSAVECEMTKFFHNMVGVFKVQLSNMVYKKCQEMGADYEKVKDGILLSGLVNNIHLSVPGHDGKLGWGGACFGPNAEAFSYMFRGNERRLIELMIETNIRTRGDY